MYCSFGALGAVALAFVLPGVVAAQNSSDPLPILDFGYALHRAADFNVSLKLSIVLWRHANV